MLRKRRQRERGGVVDDDFEDYRRKEEERYKQFEKNFYAKFNRGDNKARQNIHPIHNLMMRRFLLMWGYLLIFSILFSNLFSDERTSNDFDDLEALRKIDKKEYKTYFQTWEEEKSAYFKNSPTINVKPDKYD